MKKIQLYIIIFIGIFPSAWAQQDLKRANDLFEKKYYVDAIALYEAALPSNKSSLVIKNLADSYYHTFDLNASARWYRYLISNYGDTVDEQYYFKLNQSLKAIGEYEEANNVLIDYYTKEGNVAQLQQLKEAIAYLENVSAIGERFAIENSKLNTTTSEFGAMQVNNALWYTATHKKSTSKTYRWNNQHYLDIYTHAIDQVQLGDSLSISLSNNVNTKLHEGSFTISPNGTTMYFTRNNYNNGKRKTDDKKISNLKIYSANLVDGEWKNVTELSFNSDEYSNEHPALNADGTKLYFSSDRPGGFGSFDIYEVNLQSDNTFSTPVNLGSVINTDKKEQFPFIASDNSLYFSSNGHPGFGLLDVFISKNNNGTFMHPDNLGLPVNSGYDDFSYVLNTDNSSGYFASNRPSGVGSDDIYSFSITQDLIIEDCEQFITGIITDRTTTLPLANAMVILLNAENELVATCITKENGAFNFNIVCEALYEITAEKNGYEGNAKIIRSTKERNAEHDASMDLYSIQEKQKAEAMVLQQKQEAERLRTEQMTAKKLEADKIAAQLAEKQSIEAAERLNQQRIVEKAKAEKALAKKIEDAIKTENALVKEADRTIIQTEEIHFDYSLWYLRRESRERLQTVIDIMKKNPGMVIEIGTHTDIRGNKEYNKDLSQKRADSAKDFLVKNGIASDRVVSKGYGESKPIVVCATEEACSEEDHEWNRRCEFVVLNWEYDN
ncbi:OmpA family protein [Maribacter sp. SA7]|uniref:OmpA family protein n=1 Tax=Maribacter zhoushanensis TaxID=3030012 RepID=UPI0023ECB4B9|nr:OmpA family protein [Maribacter zhoushanensis]MDF4202098.1 OmpA family protein [Maribacter zhoushanensis]